MAGGEVLLPVGATELRGDLGLINEAGAWWVTLSCHPPLLRPRTHLGMPRVHICTCFLLSSSRFSSRVGRVKFPFADSGFGAAELLLGLYISGRFSVQPSNSGGKRCFSKWGKAGRGAGCCWQLGKGCHFFGSCRRLWMLVYWQVCLSFAARGWSSSLLESHLQFLTEGSLFFAFLHFFLPNLIRNKRSIQPMLPNIQQQFLEQALGAGWNPVLIPSRGALMLLHFCWFTARQISRRISFVCPHACAGASFNPVSLSTANCGMYKTTFKIPSSLQSHCHWHGRQAVSSGHWRWPVCLLSWIK